MKIYIILLLTAQDAFSLKPIVEDPQSLITELLIKTSAEVKKIQIIGVIGSDLLNEIVKAGFSSNRSLTIFVENHVIPDRQVMEDTDMFIIMITANDLNKFIVSSKTAFTNFVVKLIFFFRRSN